MIATCEYCKLFVENLVIDKSGKRVCRLTSKEIRADTLSCKYFKATNFFYCKKYSQRITLPICKNRRSKKYEGCMRCTQYKIVLNLTLINNSKREIRRIHD